MTDTTEDIRFHLHAEQSVLGALMLDNDAIDLIEVPLGEEHFGREDHRRIYRTITGLIASGKPADVVTVDAALGEIGLSAQCGGIAYLGEMAASVMSMVTIRRYAEIVVERATLRALMAASDQIATMALSPAMRLADKLVAAQGALMAVCDGASAKRREPQHIADILARHRVAMEERAAGKAPVISTGFGDLDDLLGGGLRPGQFVLVAARPGMGKSSLGLQIAQAAAARGITSLLCSQEMPEIELADRVVCIAGGIRMDAIRGQKALNTWDMERYDHTVRQMSATPLVMDDQPSLSLIDVATKARQVRRKRGLGLLAIDYVQLMSGSGDSRNAELERISRGLKQLAKEMSIPVVAMAQLNRSLESRPDKRPHLSDLRDCGGLEQDADVVIAIYRDETYHSESLDKGTAELLVRKNRQGAMGDCRLAWQGEFARFAPLDVQAWLQGREAAAPMRRARGLD